MYSILLLLLFVYISECWVNCKRHAWCFGFVRLWLFWLFSRLLYAAETRKVNAADYTESYLYLRWDAIGEYRTESVLDGQA